MLNFRNTKILFAAVLVSLAAFDLYFKVPFLIYGCVIFIFLAIIFYGSYYIGSQFYFQVTCSGGTNEKEIALTFDDGPAVNYTLPVLEELKRTNTKAAFFCIGNRIESQREIAMKIHEEGHMIGNHSWSHHFLFDLFSAKKMSHELRQMDMITASIIGKRPKFFRPPYGVTNPNLAKAIKEGNYFPVGWNIRSLDTVIKDEQKLLNKMKKLLRPGAIILFHDTSKTTLNILPEFIRFVLDEGYRIVRLDVMLKHNAYE